MARLYRIRTTGSMAASPPHCRLDGPTASIRAAGSMVRLLPSVLLLALSAIQVFLLCFSSNP
jgi:hypothetical protein